MADERIITARLEALDAVAREYSNDATVIGFRVYGSTERYIEHWNSVSRSPMRWRTGEWRLWSGDDGIEPVFRKAADMREPVVKFYKSFEKGGNGAFATSTTADEPEAFLRECAMEMEAVIQDREGDLEFTFLAILPQICELWAKLKGYKADGVYEKRYLVAGEPNPEAHMACVNVHDEVVASA